MKKLFALLITVLFLLSLTSCDLLSFNNDIESGLFLNDNSFRYNTIHFSSNKWVAEYHPFGKNIKTVSGTYHISNNTLYAGSAMEFKIISSKKIKCTYINANYFPDNDPWISVGDVFGWQSILR